MGRGPGAISFSAVIRGGERAERNAHRNGHSHPAIEHGHALPGRPAGLRDSSPMRSGPRGATVMLRGLRPVLTGTLPRCGGGNLLRVRGAQDTVFHYTRTRPPRGYPGCGLKRRAENPARRKKAGRRACTIRLRSKILETPTRSGVRIGRNSPVTLRESPKREVSPGPARRLEPRVPAAPASGRSEDTPGPNRSQREPPG